MRELAIALLFAKAALGGGWLSVAGYVRIGDRRQTRCAFRLFCAAIGCGWLALGFVAAMRFPQP